MVQTQVMEVLTASLSFSILLGVYCASPFRKTTFPSLPCDRCGQSNIRKSYWVELLRLLSLFPFALLIFVFLAV